MKPATALDWLARQRSSDEATIAKLAADLATNPAHALKWSADAFAAAARIEVAAQAAAVIEAKGLDVALTIARENVMRGARFPERSTSPTSNLVSECRTAAWAEFVEKYA